MQTDEKSEYRIEYNQNGEKIAEGKIIDGKRDGPWFYYNPLKAIEYENDVKLREIKYYSINKIKEAIEYLDNDVIIRKYDETGNISHKIIYDKNNKDKRDLTFYSYSVKRKLFDETGEIYEISLTKLKKIIKDFNITDPIDTLYHMTEKAKIDDDLFYIAKGKVGKNFSRGKKNDIWKYTFNDYRYLINFINDIPNGIFKTWIKENNQWFLHTEGFFDMGSRDDIWRIYEKNHLKKEMYYTFGILNDEIFTTTFSKTEFIKEEPVSQLKRFILSSRCQAIDAGESKVQWSLLNIPVTRFGSIGDGSCLIHAVLTAIDTDYPFLKKQNSNYDDDFKNAIRKAREERERLADNFTVDIYNSYDFNKLEQPYYSYENMKKRLKDQKTFIEHDMIDYISSYYQINIIFFTCSSDRDVYVRYKDGRKFSDYLAYDWIFILWVDSNHFELMGWTEKANTELIINYDDPRIKKIFKL